MARWLVVLLVVVAARAQEAPDLALRPGEVLLKGAVAGSDAGRGLLSVRVSRIKAARGDTRSLSPALNADLRLSLFGRPPCLTRGDAASFLSRVSLGATVAMVVGGGDTTTPSVLPVLDLAVGGQPALGRPPKPWPEMSEKAAGDNPPLPMIFPVLGGADWHDTFQKPVVGRPHTGQDLRAPRMTPLLACFGGIIWIEPKSDRLAANSLVILGDDRWQALYTHLNNDTPGTTDNSASSEYIFAPAVENGARVVAGQLLGWVGDSGFATGPHLHLELRGPDKILHNSLASLQNATMRSEPSKVAIWPELQPAKGEVRLDAYVKSVNVAASRVYLGVRQRNGAALSGPLYIVASVAPETRLRLRGLEETPLVLAQMPVGSAVAVLGQHAAGGFAAREIWIERQGLFVPEPLRAAVASAPR